MSEPLLRTKLHIPRLRSDLVTRPRLIRRLNDGLDQSVTLLCAPAGFGKTTLLADWVSSLERPAAWLSMDEEDNDLARFLPYLTASLQTIEESVGKGILGAFQSQRPPPLRELLAELVNEIDAVQDRFVLILDDLQHVSAQPVYDALAFVLDHPPASMHLVIATRTDPPLPIARLRGRGQLTELRQVDLCFTAEESSEFLNRTMGLGLAPEETAALTARTEGWVAGLQLAALAWRARRRAHGADNAARFLGELTGGHRFILDYLVEEVVEQQPSFIQKFLLKTSVLGRLSGPLCDFVLAVEEAESESGLEGIGPLLRSSDFALPLSPSQRILQHLETENLFVVPLDDERRWYRYHYLFAGLLRQRLRETVPGSIAELHGRASLWYEQRGQTALAIDHALSAGDDERAAQLIDQVAEAMIMRSEIVTLRNWVGALPEHIVHARLRLSVFDAWSLLLSGQPLEAAEARLQDAIELHPNGSMSGEVAAFRALVAGYRGSSDDCAALCQQALGLLPEESIFLRSLVAGILGYSCLQSGDIHLAREALEEAVRLCRETGNVMNEVLAACHLAELRLLQAQPREAKVVYDEALQLATDAAGRRLPIAGLALQGLGNLLLEWDDLETAEALYTDGIELTRRWGRVGTVQGYVGLARVKQAQEDLNGATRAMHQACQVAADFDAMEMDDLYVASWQARLWLARGDLEAAARWAESCRQTARTLPLLARVYRDPGLGAVYLAQGRHQEALIVLEPLREEAEARGWTWFVIQSLALEALTHQAVGDTDRALVLLERTLSLAEPGGFVRVFVDGGEPMVKLLRQAASRGFSPAYVDDLLAACSRPKRRDRMPERVRRTQEPPRSKQPSLREPLSERELEVLRLLAAGLSNREIAEQLIVAVSTVKSHVNNIYRKLDVSNRVQAATQARDLNLL